MKNVCVIVSFALATFAVTAQKMPYKDSALPVETRVQDLLGRMTLEEKIAQIKHIHSNQIYDKQELNLEKLARKADGMGWGFVEGFPLTAENCKKSMMRIQKFMVEETRLGIPIFTTGESLHGVVQEGSTVFPQNIALGSTFNPDLAYKKTASIAGELHYQGIKQVLSPCIDVVRELRWGRVEESFGEDPILCGIMGIAEVKGYMDNGISPMLKHYGPHGNPLGGLNLATVECGVRDLLAVYLKPFEMIFKNTDIQAVMSSYNAWNRIPNSASHYMLTELLRDQYGFKGYVYSDWGVINMLRRFHCTAANEEEAAKQALTAGLDVEASSESYQTLIPLVKNGEFDVKHIDTAVARVLRAKFKMGLFDDPYGILQKSAKKLRDKAAVELSKLIADESTVLLKNENNLLPLDIKKLKSIAVIGPNANQIQFGDYTWSKSNEDGITPLQGIQALVGNQVKVNYAYGCGLASLDTTQIAEAVLATRNSDVAILFCGSSSTAFVRNGQSPSTSGEGVDLHSIELTGAQEKLANAIIATGKPVVFVLVSGKPFAIPQIKEKVPAILAQWYAGECQGTSIADILFGKVNPSGKLSFSFPQSTGHLPCYYNHMSTDKGYYKNPGSYKNPGRDYVFSSPEALWSFGHGLSYTTFDYVQASTDKTKYSETDTIKVSVKVKNSGTIAGKEVVQIYVSDIVSRVMSPVKELKAFGKKEIAAGQTQDFAFAIPVSELSLLDELGRPFIESGEFEIQIGSSSNNIHQTCKIQVGNAVIPTSASSGKQIQPTKQSTKTITVSGEVRDVQATPVVEVEVYVKTNPKSRIKTKADGTYSIEAGNHDVLVFERRGMQRNEVHVANQTTINVKMDYE